MTPNEQVARMEKIIGYTFDNRQLAVESLYHGGFPIYFDGAKVKPERNDRLAVLGDSLLDTVALARWYDTRDSGGSLLSKGEWNAIIRNDLFTNRALDVRGRSLGLDACVIKDPGTSIVSRDMMATTFEAVIGAVFKDSGTTSLDTVGQVMERLGFFNHVFFMITTNVRDLDPG